MSKRGLNIYHRKDGRYEGRYANGCNDNGKTKYRSVYGATYGEVKDKLLKIKANNVVPATESNLTVEKLFNEWLSVKAIRTKASTYANYAFKVEKHLIPAFGKLKIERLTAKLVYEFVLEKQKSKLSNKYISDLLIVLKSMAKYASKTYHCVNNISEVTLPKKDKKELNLLTKKEQEQLKATLLNNTDLIKMSVTLAYFTGIRIGELCGLKWSDIDLTNRTLHVERTVQRVRMITERKTKLMITTPKSQSSIRIIPLPEFLIDMLKVFMPSNRDTFIVSGSYRIPEPRTVQYRFKALLQDAGLRSTNFHSLRHMFATNCIELGFDVKTLSEILGHSTVEITLNRYVHSSLERKKQCMDLISIKAA